jgi:hypothetical protein
VANPHARLMNSAGRLLVKSLLFFCRERNTLFQSLNFVRFHGASELLDEGTTLMPELEGILFC